MKEYVSYGDGLFKVYDSKRLPDHPNRELVMWSCAVCGFVRQGRGEYGEVILHCYDEHNCKAIISWTRKIRSLLGNLIWGPHPMVMQCDACYEILTDAVGHTCKKQPTYKSVMEPQFPCRRMPTRHCPAIYNDVCGLRPCARFESEDETPWRPEVEL